MGVTARVTRQPLQHALRASHASVARRASAGLAVRAGGARGTARARGQSGPLRDCGVPLRAPAGAASAPTPPPSRTNWTRLVPPPVLTGHFPRGRGAAVAHRARGAALDLAAVEEQVARLPRPDRLRALPCVARLRPRPARGRRETDRLQPAAPPASAPAARARTHLPARAHTHTRTHMHARTQQHRQPRLDGEPMAPRAGRHSTARSGEASSTRQSAGTRRPACAAPPAQPRSHAAWAGGAGGSLGRASQPREAGRWSR